MAGDISLETAAFLETRRGDLLTVAEATVARAHLPHYDAAGRSVTAERLRSLLDVVIEACRNRRLDGALEHADTLVRARRGTGVELGEIQTAINVLEESLWRAITVDLDVTDQPAALALVSTVLGAVKDRVAQRYTTPAAGERASVRVDLLFAGSEGNPSMVSR